jgi:carboxypeptidase T
MLLFWAGTVPMQAGDQEPRMLVRIDISDQAVMEKVSRLPQGLDVASVRPGEYLDLVIKPSQLGILAGAGIGYRVLMKNPQDVPPNQGKAAYHNYDGIRAELKQIAADHPAIAKLDTVAVAAQGGKVWCLKLSDQPGVNDNSRHGIIAMGLHHAREWMTPEICLNIANYLTDNYNPAGTDSVSMLLKTKEIYVLPLVNPDGFVYDNGGSYGSGLLWRKNRRINSPTVFGADLNRGYDGSVDGDIRGAWGSSVNAYTSPDSSNDVYYGASPSGEPEQQAVMQLVKDHNIVLSLTYHTYSELVLWPLGYADSTVKRAPDSLELRYFGQQMAARIKRYRSTQGYTPQQSSALYPTTGDSDGWMYGYGLTQLGRVIFSYCVEADTAFYTPASHIDSVCPQTLKGFLYLAQRTDSIVNLTSPPPVLPPPVTSVVFPSASTDYRVSWSLPNPASSPSAYELQELYGPVRDSSTAEPATDAKISLSNFTRSSTRRYQGSYSFFSGTGAYRLAGLTTVNPYRVQSSSDSFRFYSYQGMTTFDRAWVECSYDGRQWRMLGKLFGNTGTAWNRRAYSIGADSGKSIFFRIRYVGDGTTSGDGGLYIDNLIPAASFNTVTTVSSTITATDYLITGKAAGSVYYYRVRGYNAKRGWGDWDQLYRVDVVNGPMAVELSLFTALQDGADALVSWRTESETGTLRWELERASGQEPGFRLVAVQPVQGGGGPAVYSFADRGLAPGEYLYRLAEVGADGGRTWHGTVALTMGPAAARRFELTPPSPNPFSRAAVIGYQLESPGWASLTIYNIAGQTVRTLVEGRQEAGPHSASWDGRDGRGRKLPAGVYLCRLSSGGASASARLLKIE